MKAKLTAMQALILGVVLLQAITVAAQPVVKVATGLNCHTLFLKSDGSLWAMGRNNFGQLGDGTYSTNIPSGTNYPEQIVASNVIAIAAGVDHSLFLKSDGSLWAMGGNSVDDTNNPSGQLGDGTYNSTNRPEMIVASNVIATAAGGYHSLFLKSDGSLWAMGYNYDGELGDGTYNNTNRPQMIVASNVTAIAAGLYHSLFIKSDGSLWGLGYNYFGQLGDGTYGVAPYYSTDLPEEIVASNVVAIAAGQAFSFFIKSDGSLWAMGEDMYGELGDGTTRAMESGMNLPERIVTSNVTAVACGLWHTLFVERDGSMWAMGSNGRGELGGSFSDTSLPSLVITHGVIAVAAGHEDSFLIKNDGSLWGMGFNLLGELGDGTYNSTNLPEQIVAGPPGYNQISVQLLSGGNVGLFYVGMAGTNYELDRSFGLAPPNWVPQATNPAGTGGILLFTNTPDATTNSFWRIHSVP
jgi:alpha-tubulin suppressor-like RCC1 family protein